jgi:addiction module HigA family antidote
MGSLIKLDNRKVMKNQPKVINNEELATKFSPLHPGELLKEHLFEPRGLTIERVAQDIHIPKQELQEFIEGKSNLTTDIACRLGYYFQLGAKGFLNLQQIYDLEV